MADFLHESTPLTISRRAFIEGVRSAAEATSLLGRWQKIGESPLVICDTGHNAPGMKYVAEQLGSVECEKLYCVMGFARDKDLGKILPMLPKEAHYIFTQAKTDRAVVAEELLQLAAEHGLQGEAVADVKQALERARELATPADMIFVGGSTYVVGEVL